MQKIFNRGRNAEAPADQHSENPATSDSLLARADTFCKRVRPPKKLNTQRRERYKPYKPTKQNTVKEVQKGLIVVKFQGLNPPGVASAS